MKAPPSNPPSHQAWPAILIVPGLRDAAPQHWQTLLAEDLRAHGADVHVVPPMGRDTLDLASRVVAIERAVAAMDAPAGSVRIIAHSGGCIMLAHWALGTLNGGAVPASAAKIGAALLATPPDFDTPMPEGYPSLDALRAGGWLPVPRRPLPFASLIAASQNDPLASYRAVQAMALIWGSRIQDLGCVGHLNPASGFGPFPQALALLRQL